LSFFQLLNNRLVLGGWFVRRNVLVSKVSLCDRKDLVFVAISSEAAVAVQEPNQLGSADAVGVQGPQQLGTSDAIGV